MAKRKNSETLPDPQRQQLNTLIDARGVEWTRLRLGGISRHALERAAGGLTVQKMTAFYITEQLAKRASEGKAS